MSDYLWDKTGEPDAEVERLEGLLGTFGHRPRALVLPADAAPQPPRQAAFRLLFPTTRTARHAWLAAAAVLLFAFLLGASVLLRTRPAKVEDRAASAGAQAPAPTPSASVHVSSGEPRETASAIADGAETQRARRAARGKEKVTEEFSLGKVDDNAARDSATARRGVQLAVMHRSRQAPAALASQRGAQATEPGARESAAGVFEAMRAESGAAATSLFEETRLTAKEQLVYALRLTGAKLKEVQRRTRGAGDARPTPDAFAPLK